MLSPQIPINEARRHQAVLGLKLLDTAPEARFDRLARLARETFSTTIPAITLVDHERQGFKARVGLKTHETSRAVSFCGHTIIQEGCFVVHDTHVDPSFADNPLVTDAPKIRFYAGCPIHVGYHRVGALCVINPFPMSFSSADQGRLLELAELVDAELQLCVRGA